jgi:hypothetical protein
MASRPVVGPFDQRKTSGRIVANGRDLRLGPLERAYVMDAFRLRK